MGRLLADLLSKTEFMEKVGTGIKRIRDVCNEIGSSVEFRYSDTHFFTEFRALASEREGVSEGISEGVKLTELQKNILTQLSSNPEMTYDELASYLNKGRNTIRLNIKKLKKLKLIDRIGSAKTGHWVVLKDKKMDNG